MRQIPPLACFGSRWVSVAKWPFVAFLVLAREHGDAKPPHAHGLSRRNQNRGELATVAISSDDKDVGATWFVAVVAAQTDWDAMLFGYVSRGVAIKVVVEEW